MNDGNDHVEQLSLRYAYDASMSLNFFFPKLMGEETLPADTN